LLIFLFNKKTKYNDRNYDEQTASGSKLKKSSNYSNNYKKQDNPSRFGNKNNTPYTANSFQNSVKIKLHSKIYCFFSSRNIIEKI